MTRTGVSVPLEPNLDGTPAAAATFAPAHLERAMHTRSSASDMQRRQRAVQVRRGSTTAPCIIDIMPESCGFDTYSLLACPQGVRSRLAGLL